MADHPPQPQPPASTATASAGATANLDDHPVQIEAKVEDAETRAAREELKHTAISDSKNQDSSTGSTQRHNDDDMKLRSGKKTPDLRPTELLVQGGVPGDQKVSSPKKKRAHDEVESSRDNDGHRISSGTESSEGGWVMVDDGAKEETHRSEPQKKRARDETSPPADIHKAPNAATTSSNTTTSEPPSQDAKKVETSASAFASSGFSKLASSSASPFASVGTNKSVFGGGAPNAPSPFASLGTPSKTPVAPPNLPKPTLTFGRKDGSAPSPFATMNGSTTSAFGGGGGFGGGSPFTRTLGASTPGNFASPGAAPAMKSDKPAKPFGAPDSDAEDDSDKGSDSEGDEAGGSGKDAEKDDAASRDENTPAGGEDEKKAKYKKVVVDDGEAGEATIIQARARMYYLDKSTGADGKAQVGWRERGVGVLKVNVPVESVRLDPESGAADPKSFNPSVLEESTPENPKLVRLLMRQDSTLRVILNSAMLAGMEFQLKEGLKAHSVLFTAIEGEDAKHVQVQMKMSQQSAETFLKSIDSLKKKMKGDAS